MTETWVQQYRPQTKPGPPGKPHPRSDFEDKPYDPYPFNEWLLFDESFITERNDGQIVQKWLKVKSEN
jgi:hypothetical protein